MSGIDEREEYDEYSHTDSVSAAGQHTATKRAGSRNASSRASTIKKQYNFQTFYTPSQSTAAKKFQLDLSKHSNTTTSGTVKTIQFFQTNHQVNNSFQNPRTGTNLNQTNAESIIPEQDFEDSQAVSQEPTSTYGSRQ